MLKYLFNKKHYKFLSLQKRDRFIIDSLDSNKKRETNKDMADLSSDDELNRVFENDSGEDDKLLKSIGLQLSQSVNDTKDESPRTQILLKGLYKSNDRPKGAMN